MPAGRQIHREMRSLRVVCTRVFYSFSVYLKLKVVKSLVLSTGSKLLRLRCLPGEQASRCISTFPEAIAEEWGIVKADMNSISRAIDSSAIQRAGGLRGSWRGQRARWRVCMAYASWLRCCNRRIELCLKRCELVVR